MIPRLSVLATLVMISCCLIGMHNKATALSASDWRAGRIIDDTVFIDSNAMSVAQIQDFLDKKVGTGGYGRNAGQCDSAGVGTSEFGGGNRAQYGSAHGNPAPFTCLKDYYEVPKTSPSPGIPANNYGGKPIPAGAKSAAQIISDAGHQYNISPKVLLVTIQKESAGPLTTDDWPFLKQYTYAMGAHCPDGPNGPNCDTNYAGFSMQIYESASLFRYYLDNMQQPWWSYKKPYQTNQILWQTIYDGSGNLTNCGSSDVYIENMATAALYTYTPYQPNQAALNNLYGTGDYCSAYGNRNFWRIFSDWFGPSWQWGGQNVYTDATKSTWVDAYNQQLDPNTRYYMVLKAKNTGNTTWNKGNFRLGTTNPLNQSSAICDTTWINCGRPATLTENSVAPGQTGTFEFWFKTPGPGQNLKAYFNLLEENVAWLNDLGMNIPLTTGTYSWQWGGQNVYTDATKSNGIDSYVSTLQPATQYYAVLKAKNTGTMTWKKSEVKLGTTNPLNQSSAICDTTWINCGRPATLTENSVAPGQTGTFEFWFKTPGPGQNLKAYFNLLKENVLWMNDLGMNFTVKTGTYSWQWGGQNVYTDATKSTWVDAYNQQLDPNTRYYMVLKAKNTGNTTWNKGNFRLGTTNPLNQSSAICDTTWINCGRPATLTENSVAPGQTGTFEFWFKTPGPGQNLKAYFNLLEENVAWLNDLGMNIPLRTR